MALVSQCFSFPRAAFDKNLFRWEFTGAVAVGRVTVSMLCLAAVLVVPRVSLLLSLCI